MLAALVLAFSVWGFIKGIMMFAFVVVAILLVIVILLQEPKGGGLASAFGGVGAETFGVKSGGVNKFTGTLAALFMGLAILYAAIRPPEARAPSEIGATPAPSAVDIPIGEPGFVPPAEEPSTPPAEAPAEQPATPPAEENSGG